LIIFADPRRVKPRISLPARGQSDFSAPAKRTDHARQPKGEDVKLIIATIKPFKLEEVREALTGIGVRGMMVTEIKGFGAQSGHTEIYRGAEYAVNFVPKIKLEVAVSAAMADQVVDTITKAARTGKIGDGKIFVLDIQQALRVRTGETNEDAL
jgi:nitrogen regulatory protein P-II 1